jgi:CRP-like cAMP-binding protein
LISKHKFNEIKNNKVVVQKLTYKEFSAGEIIYHCGDLSHAFYLILEGTVIESVPSSK